jgi:hypothetical protein
VPGGGYRVTGTTADGGHGHRPTGGGERQRGSFGHGSVPAAARRRSAAARANGGTSNTSHVSDGQGSSPLVVSEHSMTSPGGAPVARIK